MEIKANETVEHKLHTEQVGRENSCGTHENEFIIKVQYEKTIYVSRETI